MGLEKLAIPLVFEEGNRSRLTFSDATKIRLNPDTNRIELARQSWDLVTGLPVYPTGETPWVRTWAVSPAAMRSWLSFFASPVDGDLPDGTSLRFRVSDGTTDRIYSGGSWVAAGPSDWNTHAEVAANIAAFPVTSGQIAIVVGLSTTDKNQTPWCEYVDLLMQADLEWMYSIIASSVVPELREQLQAPVDFAVDAPGGLQVSLLDVETPFNIVSVDAVYNHQADPHHRTNLLSAYSSDSRTITLTGPIARGTKLWIVFTAEPEVVVNWANQDYVEVEKIPALVVDAIDIRQVQNWAEQHVKNVSTSDAFVRRRPLRLAVRFEVVLLAEKTRTLLAMMGKALRFISDHPELRWRDLDQLVSLRALSGPAFSQRPNLSDKHEAVMELELENVYLWVAPEETVPLVERLNLTISSRHQSGPLWPGTPG